MFCDENQGTIPKDLLNISQGPKVKYSPEKRKQKKSQEESRNPEHTIVFGP